MASTVKLAVAVVLLVYLYARLQHGWYLEEPRDAQMVRMGSKVVASDLLKRGRLWRDVTRGGERQRHNSLTNRPHWFLDSLLLLAGDIELNPGPVDTVVQQHDVGDLALLLEPIAADRDLFVRQLGVPYTETETIAAEKRGYRHYALIDALQYWVNVSATPTYEQISQVLRGAFVTNFPLAKKVEEFAKKKRQTQSLPVGGGVDPASRGPQRYTTGDVMEQMKISEPWKRSLQELRSRLAETIESRLSPDRFGDALVGKGFISEPAKRDRVNVLGVTGYSKIAGLLDAVSTDINNAGNKPKRFNDFVAILNSLGLHDAEQELTECYRKYDPGYMYVDRAERKGGDVMEQMKISEPWKRSLQELRPRLADTIVAKSSAERFGDALVGRQFITEETKRGRVNVLGVSDYAITTSLLDAVSTDINNAGNKPKRFNDFVAVLDDLDLHDVGKKLIECYRKYDPGYMYVDRAERNGETGVHVEPETHDLHEREVRFKAAMEKGHVNLRVSTVFLHGPAGSGKTCSACFLVGEDPPPESKRESTAVARPVRIFSVNISKKDSKWKKLTPKQRLDFLVQTVEPQPIQKEVKETQPNVDASQPSIEQSKESHNEETESITSKHVKESSIVHEHSEPTEPSQTTPVDDIPELEIAGDLAKLLEMHNSKSSPIELDMMHIIDTGGQPQCHELMRYFVKRQTSLYIFVFKLSDEFSIKPLIAYHVNGKCVSDQNRGKQTIEEILQQCVRTIKLHKHADVQSHTGADMQSSTGDDVQSHKPDRRKIQILFLGTHKDKEGDCKEKRDTKNEKLRNLVLPKFQGHTYLYDNNYPVQLIVPVDVSPLSKEAEVRKEEKTIFDNIRNYITEECPLEPVNVPLRYYGLEILLEQLSVTTERKVLKWSECLAASKQLHFSEHVFEDAIRHLDDHCLIFHYRNVKTTPMIDIVFTDIQVLLDKVTELVEASCDKSSSGGDGWKEFRDYGRVTLKLLSQKRFEKHYNSGFFTAEDLIELFRDFFVFADLNRAEHKYFVPALLGTANHDELEQYRSKTINPSAATLSPLVLLFPNGGPQLGVFCYLIAYLLSSENVFPSAWNLKMKDDKITPECLKRNCVVFYASEKRGSISLIDSFHHLEVHVNFRFISCDSKRKIAKHILQALGGGLSKANEKLSYNEDLPEISIACRCKKGDLEFHHATIDIGDKKDYWWICSKDLSLESIDDSGVLPEDFAWLKSHRAISGKTPMPPKLTAPGTGDASAHAPLHPTTTPECVPPVTLDRRSTPDEDEEDNEDDEEYDSSGDEAGNVEIDGWPWPGKKTRYPPYGRRGDAIEIKLQEQNGTLSTITPSKAYGRPAVVCYPMKQLPHGIALIISNKKFDSARERLGTEKDEQHLRRTFRFLGYEVLVRRNCNGGKMRSFFNRNGLVSKKVKPHHNSFVCCILSHGGPDFVCGKDDVRVSIGISDGIQYKLCIAKNFPSLNGKPKLFFIQACRGHQIREVDHLPPEDVFVGYATSPDEVAYRDKRYGSPYVLELCRVLLEKSHNNDLISMHQEVEGIVPRKHKEVTNVPDPANPGRMKEVCQKPCHDAHLPKKVYFFDDTAA